MQLQTKSSRIKNPLKHILGLILVAGLVTSTIVVEKVSAYTTAGALGRSLNVYSGFTVNRSLIAPLAPAGVEGCREGQLLRDFAGVTIHETSNWSSNANAQMHAQYLRSGGQTYDVSWHYAVDSTCAYQSIPENEKAWHAGDTANGKGNAQTIAIEICDNAAGNFDQAMANAEWLAADVLYRHGVYTVNGYLFQHNTFSAYGKNCPITIRDTGRWGEFCSKTQGFLNSMVSAGGTYTPILMTATATINQAKNWAAANNATAEFIALADLYWELAPLAGVDPTVAYAQSAHETAFGRFGGVIDATYFNPCGMKTTSGGDNYDPAAHQRFSSWREGVQAHIDHLALYAGQLGYPKSSTPDPRHFDFLFGTALGVENLSGKWAPSSSYGTTVVEKMNKIRATSKLPYDAQITDIKILSSENGRITAEITAKNIGYTQWTASNNFRLGISSNGVDLDRSVLSADVTVMPGAVYVFTYTGTIPAGDNPSLTFQMIQEGAAWFGTPKTILSQDADLTIITKSTTLMIGQTQEIQISAKNTSLTTWTEKDSIRLGVSCNGVVTGRILLPENVSVDPGETYVFEYTAKALQIGNQSLAFQMLKEGVSIFGTSRTLANSVKYPTAAEVVSVTIPNGIKAGDTFVASVVVKNTDTVTWNARESIRLGVAANGIDVGRVFLPKGISVAPGESYTFAYTAKAPASGDLSLTFQMLQEGVAWFGSSRTVTNKSLDAQITIKAAPTALLAGQNQDIQMTIKNTGMKSWSASSNIRLGVSSNGVGIGRICLPSGVTVLPGASYTFTYKAKAPQNGDLSLCFQMLKEGVALFGSPQALTISVKNPTAADILSVTIPDNVKAGDAFSVSIVVKNTDTISWTAKDNIRLGVRRSGIEIGRAYLPEGVTVAPGESYTFTYKTKAPASGDLSLSFQMLQEGVTWFGSSRTAAILTRNAQIDVNTAPQALLPGQTQDLQLTVKNTGLSAWTAKDSIRLGVSSGSGNSRLYLPTGVVVASGESYTFTYKATAPANGDLSLTFQMIKEGVALFGESQAVVIPVKLPSAADVVSVTIPSGVSPGAAFSVSIVVKNTDTVIWTAKDNIRLGIQSSGVDIGRVYLSADVTVAPGESYEFTYLGTAPQTGAISLTFQMLQEGVTWFGESVSS